VETSAVILDDAANYFDSRAHASRENRSLAELIRIARHKDLRIIANAQQSKGLERSIFRCKALVSKPPIMLAHLWRALELDELHPLMEQVVAFYKPLSAAEQRRHALVVCHGLDEPAVIHVQPPAWYGDRASKNKAGRP
jgi:hypothetical protein